MKKSLAPSIVTQRDPKGLKFMQIVGEGYDGAGLDEDEAQRVNNTKGLSDLVKKFIAENRLSKKFADEEMRSDYKYLSGYKVPKDIYLQANRLRELFPGLGHASEMMEDPVLCHQFGPGRIFGAPLAEGWFAIPRWEKIAPTYVEAVQKVFDLIKQTRDGKFSNQYKSLAKVDSKCLRQTTKTTKMFQKISDEQKGRDILVFPAQFGLRHRGRSNRRALEVMKSNEFGLGVFATGCMLLTHPERLMQYNDLWILCSGDEFSPDGNCKFTNVPYLGLSGDGSFIFNPESIEIVSEYFGTPSGFYPQA